MIQQVPSIILPQVWVLGTEVEFINNLVCHVSIDIPIEFLQEKEIQIMASEVGAAAGALWCWVELSPVASTISTNYWAAIGGGGGINPATLLPIINPVAPLIEVATGVNNTVHRIILPWVIHSSYARLVIWTPVAAALPGAFWAIQALVSGKG